MLAAICYADDVVLVAASVAAAEVMEAEVIAKLKEVGLFVGSVAAAEVMEAEVIAKLKEVGLFVGAQKTHWTSHPKMIVRCIVVDGLAVLWEEVLEFVIEGVFGRKCKIRDCTQISSSQQVSGEVEIRFDFFMAPKNAAPEHCKNHNVAGFSPEFERVDDGQGTKREHCELEWESGGERDWSEEATVEMDQRWRLWHRTGHRWIEKFMNVLTAMRERALSWAGHVARMDYKDICVKALRCL